MDNIVQWINDNQDMLIGFSIKFVIAIAILIVGKIVANTVTGVMTKGMKKRQVDGAVISFVGAILKTVIFIAAIMMA
ncbi:mechanosensitive ion channel family protein, partial [Idiomarina sp. UBA3992]